MMSSYIGDVRFCASKNNYERPPKFSFPPKILNANKLDHLLHNLSWEPLVMTFLIISEMIFL